MLFHFSRSFNEHKDNDIMEANVSLGELQQKIKRLESLCQVSEANFVEDVSNFCVCVCQV